MSHLTAFLSRFETAHQNGPDDRFADERDFHDDARLLTRAAVLIPIIDRPDPLVILTQRPGQMRSHPGQVAFPGGKIDPEDHDEIAAALREADEELGISPGDVRVLGPTDLYHSGSGFAITPVVGLVPDGLDIRPNPHEVESWFAVPLDFLLDPRNRTRLTGMWQGQTRHYYEILWQDRRIWGVTAGIIANLAARLELA